LAEAIADEWRAQDGVIRPQTMPLTRLANTAIDRLAPDLDNATEQLLLFGKSDVVCYRAAHPGDLARRQQLTWDPPLRWFNERFGATLRSTEGLAFVEQDETVFDALRAELKMRDPFCLAGLSAAASLLGSLVLALALGDRELDPEAAFAAANVDKIYQAERWGWDEQAQAKMQAERAELRDVARFLELLAAPGR
jgi:chaperone required for assembly of F1-ATPase